MKKMLVVGAGFAGAAFARLAADDGVQVDIIDQHPHTRIHEHKHFTPDKKFPQTVAFREYPCDPLDQDGRYYPVESKESKMMLKKYSQCVNKEKNVIFIGRLGSFQYLNMDQVIEQTMLAYEQRKINKKS